MCDVDCEDAFGRLPEARLANISSQGALIETSANLGMGAIVQLGFILPSLRMRVAAEVVRMPAEGLGLRFLELSPVQQVALDEILAGSATPRSGRSEETPAPGPDGSCPLCEGPAELVTAGGSPATWDVECAACGGKLPLLTDLELRALRRQPESQRAHLSRSLRGIRRPLLLNLAELRAFSPARAAMENRRRQAASGAGRGEPPDLADPVRK